MTAQSVNLHTWPGRGDVSKFSAQTRPPETERFGDRGGLILVAVAERGATPERWGLGVAISVVGRTVKAVQLVVADDIGTDALDGLHGWAAVQVITTPGGPRPVVVVTRSAFCNPDTGLILRAYTGGGHLVTADEGRTLGLLAGWWGPGRGRFKGGFSIGLPGWGGHAEWSDAKGRKRSGYRSSLHRPPLRIKALGGHGLMVEWARAGRSGWTPDGKPAGHWERGRPFLGRVTDLIGPAHSFDGLDTGDLSEHLAAFDLPALDVPAAVTVGPDGAGQLLDIARAIHGLALALDDEAARWLTTADDQRDGIARMEVQRLVSPGGVATAIIRRSGITPPLAKFSVPDDDALGRWQQAAHGGWCTSDIRGQVVPVLDADVRSAYPAAWSLLGCWSVLCAKYLRGEDVAGEVRGLCEMAAGGDLGLLLDPGTYRRLGLSLCGVIPDGEPWPVEQPGAPGTGPTFDVIPLTSSTPMAFAWPDVVLAALASGRVPRIVWATRLAPVGSERVRPIPLRDGVVVRPGDDPIPALVRLRPPKGGDARLRSAIRGIANPAAWGIFARLDQSQAGGKLREVPAAWTWPPIAATVPAVARLWLATIERAVRDQGGAVVSRDTDGLAILALPEGGKIDLADGRTVAALPWGFLGDLLAKFNGLDPFGDGGEFWSMDRGTDDRPLHMVSLGPKRYVTAQPDGERWDVVGGTEHSLGGGVVDPPAVAGRDADRRHLWTFPVAEHALARATATERGWLMPWDAEGEPAFPVLQRFAPGSYAALADLPSQLGAHPFSPLVEGVTDKLYGDPGAPLTLDPGTALADWSSLRWLNTDGRPVRVGVGSPVRGSISLRTLDDWAYGWADPIPVEPVGLVEVDPRLIRRVGRGGALIDALLADPGARPEDHQVLYDGGDPGAFVAELIAKMGRKPFARRFGMPLRTVADIARGAVPDGMTVEQVLRVLASSDIRPTRCPACGAGVWRPGATYCSTTCRERAKAARSRERAATSPEPCALPGCDQPARHRSETCSNAHKVALWRLQRPAVEAASLAAEPEAEISVAEVAVERLAARSDLLARALGDRFPMLDVIAMRRVGAFRVAADEACRVLADVGSVVAAVATYGELTGCRNPHAVLVSRLRWLVDDAAERGRLADEAHEAARWAQVDRAAKRGETLRALVDRGELFADEAAGMIAREIPEEDLQALAMAALGGNGP